MTAGKVALGQCVRTLISEGFTSPLLLLPVSDCADNTVSAEQLLFAWESGLWVHVGQRMLT